jgi:transposase-like protein
LLALKGDLTLNDICKRYEVAPSQVKTWKKQLLDQGTNLFIRGGEFKCQVQHDDELVAK